MVNYTCKTLNRKKADQKFCPEKGFIGAECNIRCEEILGRNSKYCENYKICLENQRCSCPKGYEGDDFCNRSWYLLN